MKNLYRGKILLIGMLFLLFFCFTIAAFLLGFLAAPITQTIKLPKPVVIAGATDTIAYINNVRQGYYLPKLTENPILNKIAKIKACDMKDKNYFDHAAPDGQMSWHLFIENGYNYSYAGENIGEGGIGDNDVMQFFLNSPEHRDNILSPHYSEIGVATCGYDYVEEFASPK
jgi:uncharacterized protein YkwD